MAPAAEAFLRDLECARLRALVEPSMPAARALHAPAGQRVTPGGAALSGEACLMGIEAGAKA